MTNPIRNAMNRLPGNWHKGSYTDEEGNFCGWGHIAYHMSDERWTDGLDEMFRTDIPKITSRIAAEQFPERQSDYALETNQPHFPSFNDHEDTTEEDVLLVLEKAAIEWEEKE